MAEQQHFNKSSSTIPPLMLTPPSRHLSSREDCWTEEATSTLIDAWGRRFVDLNRGNLRQKDWNEVADMVNSVHGHTKKTLRTDVQCKNRIDTLKKKYKAEKARVSASNGLLSSWSFYSSLDSLIGSSTVKNIHHPSLNSPLRSPPLASTKPLRAVVTPLKRPSSSLDDSYFFRNYSAAATTAAAAEESENSEDESEDLGSSERSGEGDGDGMIRIAMEIVRFGKIYERVEREKHRQMIELEKQRIQIMKDLEVQRMQLFIDTLKQLEKVKQTKPPSASNDEDMYN